MMLLYSFGLFLALLLAAPWWLVRMARGRYRTGLRQRLGRTPQSVLAYTHGQPTLWLHAVSVGELIAATPLIHRLEAADPRLPIVLSTTTDTGQQLARQRFPAPKQDAARVFYYPLDFAFAVRRVLSQVRPRALVLMESELWPRMIVEAHRHRIPIIVVNARISDRSLPRYRALRWLWRPLLRRITLILAQSEQDAERFRAIGAPEAAIRVVGNLKFDLHANADTPLIHSLREHLPPGVPVCVAGSTLAGEEEAVLGAFQQLVTQGLPLVLILAPRHPQRFDEVRVLLAASGLPWVARSQWSEHPSNISAGSVFLLDSIGELASIYSLGSVAFIGGSLVDRGGHNPLEAAQFGVPIVTGPFMQNFRTIHAELLAEQAAVVAETHNLTPTLHRLLTDGSAPAMGERARSVFLRNAGATERCAQAILEILHATPQERYP
jgi:3-deoxy-D-manno-octulosonic-acid transferase